MRGNGHKKPVVLDRTRKPSRQFEVFNSQITRPQVFDTTGNLTTISIEIDQQQTN